MKNISLGIAERIQLIGVFNQVKGDVETLQAVLEDVKEVSITDEEKTSSNFREIKDETGKVVSFAWDATDAKSLDLSEKTVAFVLKFIDEKSKAQEFTVADAPLLEINRKLTSNE